MFGITREAADEFSLRSHQKALAAIQAGKFADEVVPVPVSFSTPNGSKPKRQEIVFKVDEGPRGDTSLEALLGAEARLSREGHRDGRELVADVGRRGRGRRHVGRAGARRWASSRWLAMWPSLPQATSRKKWDSARCSRFRKR